METSWWRFIALGTLGAGLVVLVVFLLRPRCASCRRRKLELDLSVHAGGIEEATGGRMFRCTGCGAEFRCRDHGPLIPRAAWDAGAREPIPKARVRRSAR